MLQSISEKILMMQDRVMCSSNVQDWTPSVTKHQLAPGKTDMFPTALQLRAVLQTGASQIHLVLL